MCASQSVWTLILNKMRDFLEFCGLLKVSELYLIFLPDHPSWRVEKPTLSNDMTCKQARSEIRGTKKANCTTKRVVLEYYH